jgi:hypothetical protein
VVLDAPPVGNAWTDARLLVRLTQAAIFVIGAGTTPFPVVERAIGELGRNYIVATVMHGIGAGPVWSRGNGRSYPWSHVAGSCHRWQEALAVF